MLQRSPSIISFIFIENESYDEKIFNILKYLKTDEITFLGAFNFVEIFSAEDMKKYEKLLTESEELLKVTAIEEEFYDECTK